MCGLGLFHLAHHRPQLLATPSCNGFHVCVMKVFVLVIEEVVNASSRPRAAANGVEGELMITATGMCSWDWNWDNHSKSPYKVS